MPPLPSIKTLFKDIKGGQRLGGMLGDAPTVIQGSLLRTRPKVAGGPASGAGQLPLGPALCPASLVPHFVLSLYSGPQPQEMLSCEGLPELRMVNRTSLKVNMALSLRQENTEDICVVKIPQEAA